MTMSSSGVGSRPFFEPVDTSFVPPSHSVSPRSDDRGGDDVVESPSLTSGNALARFEFEPGRSSKDGTKVLMVEWEEDETTLRIPGDWELSWEEGGAAGQRTVSSTIAVGAGGGEGGTAVNRLYFLLPPGVAVPTTVRLAKGSGDGAAMIGWRTNPLPAIFPPELGAKAGRKGVLHTIWAKKRLQVLQAEIAREEQINAEGVGLEMAITEKDWIESHFGVPARPSAITLPPHSVVAAGLNSPASPRSPGGGRLMDKLKGLRLGTSEQELSTPSAPAVHNPLSPESSDVAIGSFGSFGALKGVPATSSLAAKPPQKPQSQSSAPRRITAHRPPESFAPAAGSGGGMGSLNAWAAIGDANGAALTPLTRPKAQEAEEEDDDDGNDDLFALPMSPRSPDMAKSPFSFQAQDTSRYCGRAAAE